MTRVELHNEELYQDSPFDSNGSDLYDRFRGRKAQLQKDRQKLSDERQQRVQLRKELRLRQDVRKSLVLVEFLRSGCWLRGCLNHTRGGSR